MGTIDLKIYENDFFQWVNGKQACTHSGGHLPFEADVTELLLYGTANLVTVAVNSTLTLNTLPQGYVQHPNDTRRYSYFCNECNILYVMCM